MGHSQSVPVITIMHQYTYHEKGKTIYSSVQIEWYNNDVNEKSRKANGNDQQIITHEGYIFLLQFSQGLIYLSISYPGLHTSLEFSILGGGVP